MKVLVRYFASVREAMGVGSETVDTQATTLGDLRAELVARGGLYAKLASMQFAPDTTPDRSTVTASNP